MKHRGRDDVVVEACTEKWSPMSVPDSEGPAQGGGEGKTNGRIESFACSLQFKKGNAKKTARVQNFTLSVDDWDCNEAHPRRNSLTIMGR